MFENVAFNERIPQFIYNSEIRISRDLKTLEGKRVANSRFLAGTAIYQKPNRWRQTISMNYAKATAYPVTSRVNVAGVRTLTLSKAIRFTAGQNIAVYNIGGTGYNGTVALTSSTQLSVTYSQGSGSESITADFGGFISEVPQNYTHILPRSAEYCREYWPDMTQKDYPLYFGDFDFNNFIITPTPLAALPWQLNYYETPEHLSDTNDENWITEQAPDMLLYAALVEAFTYLTQPAEAAAWEAKYQASGQSRGMEAKNREADATIDRDIGT